MYTSEFELMIFYVFERISGWKWMEFRM